MSYQPPSSPVPREISLKGRTFDEDEAVDAINGLIRHVKAMDRHLKEAGQATPQEAASA